jgi:hypothetical protein
MAFKRMGKVPKGKLVPMYLSDDGDLYSLRYKDQKEIDEVSDMMALFLGGIMGNPLVMDDEPLNGVAVERFMIVDKGAEKKN